MRNYNNNMFNGGGGDGIMWLIAPIDSGYWKVIVCNSLLLGWDYFEQAHDTSISFSQGLLDLIETKKAYLVWNSNPSVNADRLTV